MSNNTSLRFAPITAVLFTIMGSAQTASAAKIEFPTHLRAGQQITIKGNGLQPNKRVVVSLQGQVPRTFSGYRVIAPTDIDQSAGYKNAIAFPTFRTDNRGSFSQKVWVPSHRATMFRYEVNKRQAEYSSCTRVPTKTLILKPVIFYPFPTPTKPSELAAPTKVAVSASKAVYQRSRPRFSVNGDVKPGATVKVTLSGLEPGTKSAEINIEPKSLNAAENLYFDSNTESATTLRLGPANQQGEASTSYVVPNDLLSLANQPASFTNPDKLWSEVTETQTVNWPSNSRVRLSSDTAVMPNARCHLHASRSFPVTAPSSAKPMPESNLTIPQTMVPGKAFQISGKNWPVDNVFNQLEATFELPEIGTFDSSPTSIISVKNLKISADGSLTATATLENTIEYWGIEPHYKSWPKSFRPVTAAIKVKGLEPVEEAAGAAEFTDLNFFRKTVTIRPR